MFSVDKPLPPRNIHAVEIYADFIVVAWEVPESDGGEPIIKYTVERRTAEKAAWVKVDSTATDTLTLKATKLIEETKYLFRVVAENSIGVSEPCEMKEPVTAKLPYGIVHAFDKRFNKMFTLYM